MPSLWLRNIQLCSLSCLTGVLLVAEERAAWREGSTLRTHGPLHNFDRFVALFILLGGSGGIVVALVIKHADNIRRGFAAGLALILTSLGSHVLYGFTFTPEFVAGTLMVVLSIFLFNGNLSLHACADVLRGT